MASLMDMLTGGDEYSQERENAENPKAHDEIDSLLEWNDAQMGMSQEDLMNMIMGGIGGAPGSLKSLTALIRGKGGIATKRIIAPGTKSFKELKNEIYSRNSSGLKNMKQLNDAARPSLPAAQGGNQLVLDKANKVLPKGMKEIQKDGKGNLIDYLISGAGGGYFGQVLEENSSVIQNLQNTLLETLRPDPDMPQKEELDEDMKKIIDMMGSEQNYKHLKNTGQGYPADPEMWYNSEEWLNK